MANTKTNKGLSGLEKSHLSATQNALYDDKHKSYDIKLIFYERTPLLEEILVLCFFNDLKEKFTKKDGKIDFFRYNNDYSNTSSSLHTSRIKHMDEKVKEKIIEGLELPEAKAYFEEILKLYNSRG